MIIRSICIYQIDTENSQIIHIEKDKFGAAFDNYLNGLIKIITKGGNGRSFNFDRVTTEIRSLIPQLCVCASEDFQGIAETAAKRLLTCEQTIQQKVEKLNVEIQKGIFLQAVVEDDARIYYVICKAEHSEFLKDEDYELTKGLPIKKKVFKAFIANFQSPDDIDGVLVYDTNATMSKYWWKDFLELSEVYTDKHNTNTAFDAIDKTVFTKMKKESPQDYVYLRNSAVRYFRAKEDFEMQDFLDNAIGDYQPYSQKVNVQELKKKIQELPKTKKFDERFSIVREEIKAKFINRIPLTPQIELHLKEDVLNIESIITAEQDQDGTKFVKIRSDEGYKYFNDLQKKE
ncbi:MAG: hypothetical protein EOO43_03375 [Flavobacterium sp.]|nr:MAG: hypothetical protein EOO43_03375 [Flavobacterium sp.]